MFRSGIETSPVGTPSREAKVDVGVRVGLHPRLHRVVDAFFLRRLEQQLEHPRIDGRAAEDRRPAAEHVVAAGRCVVARHIGRVRDVERDRDVWPERVHRRLRALRAELLLGGADEGDVHGLDPPQRLQRDVDARAVVEASRGDTPVGELERRRDDDDRVADLDE